MRGLLVNLSDNRAERSGALFLGLGRLAVLHPPRPCGPQAASCNRRSDTDLQPPEQVVVPHSVGVRIPRDFAGDIEPAKARILSASVLPEAFTIYRSAGCDTGPLMMGACAGGGSGAGILFSKVGICGPVRPRECWDRV
jgi:hypothetical protein